jgi:toxin ParE1/3/4
MPSSRRLRFTPEADADLESLLQYTAQTWGEHQMRVYAALIFEVLDRLATFPGIGRRRDEIAPGLQSHSAAQHVIIYRATADELIVQRIIHGRRDLAAAFNE